MSARVIFGWKDASARLTAPVMAAALLLLAACAGLRGPETSAGSAPGTTRYAVEGLSFEMPSAWRAGGSPRAVKLTHPEEIGVLDVTAVQQRFADEKACLAAGTEALARGDRSFQNVRRHHSTFGGRPAITQEADQGAWHGWAWAVCDGGTQYRIFFSGRAPVAPDVIGAWRAFTKSARIAPR
ncbi:MAG TPA: hypothetical protein VFK85_15120 [Anaeromyxobacteraceae bacterium]|nr:hypothetical protein [Anaeromyxobacteraceae bacterium]